MELHNYLIMGWYLFSLLTFVPAAIRGWDRIRWWNIVLNLTVYPTLIYFIASAGSAGTWQAITLFIWWTISTCVGFAKVNERVDFGAGTVFFSVLLTIVLGLLGLTMP